MRKAMVWTLALLTLASLPGGSGMLQAQEPDEAAVLEVVKTLFDGMRQKDEAMLRSVFHPEARLHTAAADGEGTPVTRGNPAEAFLGNVLSAQAHLDEVTFDEAVLVDGNMAMAWTPYNLFVDGAFQHCGVDLFVMTRSPEGWKILQVVDTRTREGCDPERRG